ncbi:sensor histidine kinase [Candidatus Jidaibacter acanthamoebae]|uniref:sensor histidine kinase n=1 Tax=Candidatus Jidaibacter acanthamoebae TaxID=86105 RepID=UPI00057F124F|nr:sensor histidine kinase [Candidatus Jidaibacter acanthamoeba]
MQDQYIKHKEKPAKFITKFIILEVVLFLILITWYISNLQSINYSIIKDKLTNAAESIEVSFTDPFDNARSIISYIGELIVKFNADDNQKILNLLDTFHDQSSVKELVTWSAIIWSDNAFNIRVDSGLGIMKSPYKNISTRHFLPDTVTQPWKLRIGSYKTDIVTGTKVIPFGMGITNEAGQYLGTITSGFELFKLEQHLSNIEIYNKNISFFIIDKEGKVIIKSKGSIISENLNNFIKKFINSKNYNHLDITAIPWSKDAESIFITKLRNLKNFYIVVVFNEIIWDELLLTSFKKTFYNLSLIFCLCIIILIFVNKFVVQPVIELSDVAEKISSNDRLVEINEYTTKEISLLASSLKKVILQKAELVEANEKLEFLLKKLEAMNKTKLDFIRNIQHELRTPLNHIIGGCDVLGSEFAGPMLPEYFEYIQIIHQSGRDLLGKINNIIAVADFESGNVKLNESKCSIKEIIDNALNALIPKIKQHKLNLKLDIQHNLPYIYLDPEKIKIVLLNFINNSIVFNKPNGDILISALQSVAGIIIEISDTGQGIHEDNLHKITEMFSTTGDVLTKVKSGLGLGLTIAQSILDLHDIKMEIESKVNQGTKIKISIPNIRLEKH